MKLYVVRLMYAWGKGFTDVAVYIDKKRAIADIMADPLIEDYLIEERELESLPSPEKPTGWPCEPATGWMRESA